jgi:DNA-binding transcriptional LysR family regulator
VAEARSFTGAAQRLGVPKQTLSRRVALLERALGVELMQRTTRRLHLTDLGAAYAERCAEIARLAEEANRAVSDADPAPRGTLRITADPAFGDAGSWPEVRVEVVLTPRKVDLLEEGFDVAFRIGQVDEPALSGFRLGPAHVRYCASPAYLARRGRPKNPSSLAVHDCLIVGSDGVPARWPFRGKRGLALIPVSGRLTMTSLRMARAAALAGLGIGLFPEFVCAEDLRRKRLVAVLDDWAVEVGSVWLLHAARRFLSARVRAFAQLARARFAAAPPWVVRRR